MSGVNTPPLLLIATQGNLSNTDEQQQGRGKQHRNHALQPRGNDITQEGTQWERKWSFYGSPHVQAVHSTSRRRGANRISTEVPSPTHTSPTHKARNIEHAQRRSTTCVSSTPPHIYMRLSAAPRHHGVASGQSLCPKTAAPHTELSGHFVAGGTGLNDRACVALRHRRLSL